MEMAGSKGRGWNRYPENLKLVIRSAQKIEDGISSTSTVTWDPFTVFPKEIYLKIFNLLDNLNDKQSFINAHTKWYELFKNDRSLFLFGNVLKTLAKNGNNEAVYRRNGRGDYYGGVAKDLNGLNERDYLNLRLVCRYWDVGMQRYIHFHPSNFRLERDEWEEYECHRLGTPEPYFGRGWIMQNKLDWRRGVGGLNAQLKNILVTHPPSRNPFLTRKVRILLMRGLGFEEEGWHVQVYKLLGTYGHHVWHCEFIFDGNRRDFFQLAKWLFLMPELKTLKLCVQKSELQTHPEWEMLEIDKTEIPELPKLSVIKCCQLSTVYFNKLLTGIRGPRNKVIIECSHFRGLDFRGHCFPPGVYQLPSVSEACLLLGQLSDINLFNQLQFLPLLAKLTLKIVYKNSSKSSEDWQKIWKFMVEAFQQLEELNLVLPKVDLPEELDVQEHSLNWRLNLPKLKKLKIVLPNLVSLDFLLLFKDLEELQIVIEYEEWGSYEADALGTKEIIDFNTMDFEKMWESNIWEVFPNLRKLHIKAMIRPWPYSKAFGPYCYSNCAPEMHCYCLRRRVWLPRGVTFPSNFYFDRSNLFHQGESPWHLYGYVKKGLNRRKIYYDPTNPKTENWAEMYKLFLSS